MNFKKILCGLCSVVMAATMIPVTPLTVHAMEIPDAIAIDDIPFIDSSKFPHASGSQMNAEMFWNKCGKLKGKITFSKARYPGSGGVALNSDSTVFAVISGSNATIYSKNGGGVFAPQDSTGLFAKSMLDLEGNTHYRVAATALDLTGLDTSQVRNMYWMFGNSPAPTLNVTGFNTENVTNMSVMFHRTTSKNIIGLWNFNTTNVTDTSNMFSHSKMPKLDLSNFDLSKVERMDEMFMECAATTVLCRNNPDMNALQNSSLCSAKGFQTNYWGPAKYAWSADNSSCVATSTRLYSAQKKTTNASVSKSVTKNPTCTEKGNTKYVAKFNVYWAETLTKNVTGDIPALGHTMGTATYSWASNGKSCTAIRKCTRAGCTYTESSKGTIKSSVVKQPTCTGKGQTKYSATFPATWAKPQTKTLTDINANGHAWKTVWSQDASKHWHECSVCHAHKDEASHNWGAATYNFASNGSSCTASRKCTICGKTETISAKISKQTVKQPNCTVKGETKYTATFTQSWAKTQYKTIADINIISGNHSWGPAEYVWTENGNSCIAIRTCNHNIHHEETESVVATGKISREPTCTAKGETTYTAAFKNSWAKPQVMKKEDIPVLNHSMGTATYSWSADGKSCMASRKCTRPGCNYVENSKGTITSSVSKNPTCTGKGQTTYTSKFPASWASTQTKVITDVNASGHKWQDTWSQNGSKHWHECSVCHVHKDESSHNWGATTYNFAADGSKCIATHKCTICGKTESAAAIITKQIVKQPTCIEKGQTKYNAAFSVDWATAQSKTITDVSIDSSKHIWEPAEYVWSEDGKSCIAIRVCKNSIHHEESETANVTEKITSPATCTNKGKTTYTATFENPWAKTQTTTRQDIEKLNHTMSKTTYNWSLDGKSCTATRKCARDGCSYTETSNGVIKANVSKSPTCTEKGQTTYTATFDKNWAEIQSKILTDVPANGHSWQEAWSKNGSKHWHECAVCHTHKDEANHLWDNGEVVKEPSCSAAGEKLYTCSVCGQTKTESIPVLNHEMGEPVYMWAENGKSCAAIRKCTNNGCEYKETDTGIISSTVNKAPTCGTAGDTEYTATFTQPWAVKQNKIVIGDIPATGNHIYDNDADVECNICGHIRAPKANTIPINEITFPDDNFRNWVLNNIDGKEGAPVVLMFRSAPIKTKDGQLDDTEQQATGSIDVHAQGIKDLRGIEYFPNLRILDCSDNQLDDLNLSNNDKLEHVDASNNPGLDKVEINNDLDGILHPTVDENVEVDFVDPHLTKHSGEGNNIPVVLTTAAHAFSVTIPTSLPISVAADGVITCADAAACKVVNNEEGPVDIKSIALTGDNSWTIVPTTTAMESEAVNTKKLAMTVMGYNTNNGGLDTTLFQPQTINGNADFGIVYTAKLPTQTIESDKAPVANVVFTIGWHEVR